MSRAITTGNSELGLIIPDEFIGIFIENYIRANPEEFDGEDHEENVDMMYDALTCNEEFTSDEGITFHAKILQEDPYYPNAGIYPLEGVPRDVMVPVIFIQAAKPCTAKTVFSGHFYSSQEELIAEMQKKVGMYLPDDFEWEENIGNFEYAWCA